MRSGLYYSWEGTGGGTTTDAADLYGQIMEQVESDGSGVIDYT